MGLSGRFIQLLTPDEVEIGNRDWPVLAREVQKEPEGDWRTWLFMGGRGAGKTRAGAEWLKGIATADPHYMHQVGGRLALVGASYHDVKEVMIEGEAGLLAAHATRDRPQWIASRRLLRWDSGVTGQLFTANDPDSLRGFQFGAAWCDEIVKWQYAEPTWNMLQFCMRLGANPRQMVTTTPKPMPLMKKLVKAADTVVTRSATSENAPFLSPAFIGHMNQAYGNSRLGRQELGGELIEDREDALWKRSMLEAQRVHEPEPLQRIVIAVDPPATSGQNADACGIVAAGRNAEGKVMVLADATIEQASPSVWAKRAVSLFHAHAADAIIAETNQGGEMVKTIIHQIDPNVPIRSVHATRGKWLRAEPVALLYEQGRVQHVGTFAELEDQMCDFSRDGLSSGRSPDRIDALVWAITALVFGQQGQPQIRNI